MRNHTYIHLSLPDLRYAKYSSKCCVKRQIPAVFRTLSTAIRGIFVVSQSGDANKFTQHSPSFRTPFRCVSNAQILNYPWSPDGLLVNNTHKPGDGEANSCVEGAAKSHYDMAGRDCLREASLAHLARKRRKLDPSSSLAMQRYVGSYLTFETRMSDMTPSRARCAHIQYACPIL